MQGERYDPTLRRSGVDRRQFVATVGAIGAAAALGLAGGREPDPVRIRVVRSERASRERGLVQSVQTLVETAMAYPFWDVTVFDGGVVSVSDEDAARAVTSGEWPRLVGHRAPSATGGPVWDVNLLVTSSQMVTAPTGYAISHVAAVGGARHLADFDREADVVALSPGAFSAHVLLHEIGHALGLAHEHGARYRGGAKTVATPMLSTYAWSDEHDYAANTCGEGDPMNAGLDTGSQSSSDEKRHLQFRFSDCARRELARYARE